MTQHREKPVSPRAPAPSPRGGSRPGAGRKAGWFQTPTRAATEAAILRVVNDMYHGREVEVRKGRKTTTIVERLDPQIGNACLNGLKAILQSKQFTESLSLKEVEREILRRISEAEEQLERYAELMRERGIPDDLLRRRNGGSYP